MKRSLVGTSLLLYSLSIWSCNKPSESNATDGTTAAPKKSEASATASGPRIAVTGSVLFKPNGHDQIYVADLPVTLKGGKAPQDAKTDVAGRYRFFDVAPGKYTVCWEQPGWVSGCTSEIEVTAEDSGYANIAELKPTASGSVAWGNVTLADGTSAVLIDYTSDTEAIPTVEALDAGGNSIGKARTNAAGWYAIGVRGTAATFRVVAGELRQDMKPDRAAEASSGAMRLKLNNHRPVFSAIDVFRGTAAARSAKPGEVLTLRPNVSDPDGDRLRYIWSTSAGTISSTADGVATWKLPDFPATLTAYCLVIDNRGGASVKEFSFVPGLEFAPNGPPVCNPLSLAKVPPPQGYPPTPPFLTFLLDVDPTNGRIKDHSADYYKNVDPQSLRTTLGAWWKVAGFNKDDGSGGVAKAAYLNWNDLGFGRDMHFNQVEKNIYAWVTNYGCPNNDPNNANLAANPVPANAKATVCMEYAPVEGTTTAIVKFFVYAGGQAGGTRQGKADLDEWGLKPVPNLCQTCHGGTSPYTGGTATVNLGSSFIPFDLALLRFPGPSVTPPPGDLKEYYKMNRIIADGTKPKAAIVSLVNGWYTPLKNPPSQNFYLPSGWQSRGVPASAARLYGNVIHPGCRTCHYSFSAGISWDSYQGTLNDKPTIQSYVCGPGPVMPHAAITYINFWTNTYKFPISPPNFLGAYSDSNWPAFGGCTGK
jgi:hypothetical protein